MNNKIESYFFLKMYISDVSYFLFSSCFYLFNYLFNCRWLCSHCFGHSKFKWQILSKINSHPDDCCGNSHPNSGLKFKYSTTGWFFLINFQNFLKIWSQIVFSHKYYFDFHQPIGAFEFTITSTLIGQFSLKNLFCWSIMSSNSIIPTNQQYEKIKH